jgi:hypothetical protein
VAEAENRTDGTNGATATSGEPSAEPEQASDGAHEDAGTDEGAAPGGGTAGGERFDLRAALKQLTAPMLESLDARLREQVEAHSDELLSGKVEAAVADRLSTVDRAIADLSRALEALEQRIAALERGGEPLPEA